MLDHVGLEGIGCFEILDACFGLFDRDVSAVSPFDEHLNDVLIHVGKFDVAFRFTGRRRRTLIPKLGAS